MRKSKKATRRRQSRREVLASQRASLASEWEVYGVSEKIEAPALLPSHVRVPPQIRPVVAVRQTSDRIELLFFPD